MSVARRESEKVAKKVEELDGLERDIGESLTKIETLYEGVKSKIAEKSAASSDDLKDCFVEVT